MVDVCPTCGQPIMRHEIASIGALEAALRKPVPRKVWPRRSKKAAPTEVFRSVYAGQDGNYYITYGGGSINPGVIRQAVSSGVLVPEYPDEPKLECWRLA